MLNGAFGTLPVATATTTATVVRLHIVRQHRYRVAPWMSAECAAKALTKCVTRKQRVGRDGSATAESPSASATLFKLVGEPSPRFRARWVAGASGVDIVSSSNNGE